MLPGRPHFSPRALNQALKGVRALRFCQILQEQPGQVLVRGVASDPLASDDIMTIRKNLQQILGKSVSVSAMLADTPIVRPGGKIPLIIQSTASRLFAGSAIHQEVQGSASA